MTAAPVRRVVRLLASPRLATALLIFLGAWAIGASFIPQNAASAEAVAVWRMANPGLVPFVDALGLHDAFMSPLFIVPGLFLALCTAVCAWQRTGVARRRARMLRSAEGTTDVVSTSTTEVHVAVPSGMDEGRAVEIAAETLKYLGIPTTQRGSSLVSVSPWWTVWGTAIFHWALVAIIALITVGGLVRAEGQMGVGVGQVRPDQPESYGQLTAGPLYRWGSVDRSIRVDDFHLDYEARGVRRGPSPTVAVLNADGEVLESRIVYPNHILRHGSLSIYPVDYGLSASFVVFDKGGAEALRDVQLVDFDGGSPDGTSPIATIDLPVADGTTAHRLSISIPLDSVELGFLGRLPDEHRAHVVVTDLGGSRVLDEVVKPGEQVDLPFGRSLELLGIDYYARMQLVDDPTVPLLYVAGAISMIGLGIATLARQMLLSVQVEHGVDGPRLAVNMRLWRIHSTSRSEIEDELRRSLDAGEGSA